MKIKDIKIFVTCPGRNFVTVKIITDEGIYGLGDATLNGREMAVVAYLEEHIVPCLIGKDAHQIEDIWQFLYKGTYWRNGGVGMTAIGAIDMALWDIKGKVCGLPVYQLLGGKSRKGVTVYCHVNGETIDEVLANIQVKLDKGYQAIRLQCAIPGHSGTYGTLQDKKDYYELQGNRPLPPVQVWSTKEYLNFIPELFRAAREKFGFEFDLLHDVHSRLTPVEAGKLGQLLEPYNLLFLEDAVIAENQDNYKLVRDKTTTPLAVGEVFDTIWAGKRLIENQWIDYIRMAASHGGGITSMRKVADFAAIYNVRIAPHGAPDLSPICFAANLHVDLWANNFGIQEFVGFGTDKINEIFKYQLNLEKGLLYLDETPGLGVDFDEEAAAKYPYKRSYLPVSRLRDDSIWYW